MGLLRRLLHGRYGYLLPIPLVAVGAWAFRDRAPPDVAIRCVRSENLCSVSYERTTQNAVPLDVVQRFEVVYWREESTWLLQAVTQLDAAPLLPSRDRLGLKQLAAAMNEFRADGTAPAFSWRPVLAPDTPWWREQWMTSLALVLVLYGALWYVRLLLRQQDLVVSMKRCGNGHLLAEEAVECPECGTRLMRNRR
jgi:hypothetical protein